MAFGERNIAQLGKVMRMRYVVVLSILAHCKAAREDGPQVIIVDVKNLNDTLCNQLLRSAEP